MNIYGRWSSYIKREKKNQYTLLVTTFNNTLPPLEQIIKNRKENP